MAFFRRIANLFHSSRIDREIDAELRAHIEMRIEENIAAGMTRDEATRDARVRFGNPTSTREHVAAADAHLGLAGFGRDLRYALRQLRRSPGFALTAIVTLALGIGANVVVFGVMNAIILTPLKVTNAGRLVQLAQSTPGNNSQSYPDFLDLRARSAAFEDMAAYRIGEVGVSTGGSAQRGWDYEVSASYFDMLGVQPALGRFFHAADDHGVSSMPYVVLSDGYWRRRFNADPNVVGKTVELNRHQFTVLGVTPASFNGTELLFWPDIFVPMVNEEQIEGYNFLTKRGNHGTNVIGMMRAGVTVQQAQDNLNALTRQMQRENPKEDDGLAVRLVKPGLMGDLLAGPTRAFLAGLMVLSMLVLLAAGANLAGIFAARAVDRTRELAIRLSIGSTRWRILRQVLTEGTVLAVLGGVAGTAGAWLLLGLLSRWHPISAYPIGVTVTPGPSVFVVAFLLSIAGGILPGLLPARQIWRTDTMHAMKPNGAAGKVGRLSLRDVLLSVQITLCALLVTAALVSLRGMDRSLHAPMGFEPRGAVMAATDMHMAGYSDDSALPLQQRILEELAKIPGVSAVGTVNAVPLSGNGSDTSVYREGTADLRPSNALTDAQYYSISPGYLHAAGTRLLAGRNFTWADTKGKPEIVLVNETFAKKLCGNENCIGRHFWHSDRSAAEIVGVVEDGKYQSLTEDQMAAMFYPLAQSTDASTAFVVRSDLPAAETAAAVNRVIQGVDSSLPLDIRTWTDGLALVLFPARAATGALSVMGALAAMLAVTGVFGMAAYSVSKRLRELGLRVALGAQRGQVMRTALARPVTLLMAGSIGGVLLGVLASRLLASIVYQATPRDPVVLAGAAAAMIAIGAIATWIPAQRALRVNPAQLLRED